MRGLMGNGYGAPQRQDQPPRKPPGGSDRRSMSPLSAGAASAMPLSGPVAFPVPGFQGPPPGGGISPFPLPGMQGPAPAGPAMMPFSPGGFQGMPPAMPPQGPGAGIESLLGGMGGGGQMPPELLMRLLALRA